MNKIKYVLYIWLIALMVLPACGKIGDPAADVKGSGPVKEFTVQAQSSGYDIQEIKVKQGDTVKITLKNMQGMHSLKIKGYNKEVRGNKTITFVADRAGTFEYACNISCGKNHKEMVGKLIVQ
ncbi:MULTISPECIES: cupredoxin domain-containing protein [Paenibacillus]|uniref:cupredoxin domain-containing protein n=1 Tax=Paenibacillus TaxID=44249 RepID=UPI002FE17AC5